MQFLFSACGYVGSTKFRKFNLNKSILVYPYDLNEKMDIYKDNKNAKRFKSDDAIVRKLFPSIPRLF